MDLKLLLSSSREDLNCAMEANRDLYKVKSRSGLASREKRAHLKSQESKSGRDALLLSKRRIPLSPLQEKHEEKNEISKGERN